MRSWSDLKDALLADFREWSKRVLEYQPAAELETAIATDMIREMYGQARQSRATVEQVIGQLTIEQLEGIAGEKRKAAVEAAQTAQEVQNGGERVPTISNILDPHTGAPLRILKPLDEPVELPRPAGLKGLIKRVVG